LRDTVKGELKDEGIVHLKEKVTPGERLAESMTCSTADDSDGRLRDPSESLREEIVRTVKVCDSISELISYLSGRLKVTLNPTVPVADSGVESEPGGLEFADLGPGPSEGCCHGFNPGAVIGSVDSTFKFVSHGKLSRLSVTAVAASPECAAVMIVYVHSGSKGLLKVSIVRFPCHDLGVGSGKINVAK